jgi:hypothetical protein
MILSFLDILIKLLISIISLTASSRIKKYNSLASAVGTIFCLSRTKSGSEKYSLNLFND